jgi:hypothetical protein
MPVLMVKVAEDESSVEYRFGPTEERMGLLRLDKKSGDIYVHEAVPSEDADQCFFSAALKAREHWRAQSYPARSDADL